MRRFYLILGASVFALLLVCSKKSTTPEDNLDPAKMMQTSLALQDSVGQRVVDWLGQTDTTAALNSGINLLMNADNLVDTAFVTDQGIAIQFKNGMQGGIMINAGDGLPLNAVKASNDMEPSPSDKIMGTHPEAAKTLFLCPIYYERQAIADSLIASAKANFAKAGYDEFSTYLGSNCRLNAFRQLDNLGLIHIYSHSFAWPNGEAAPEIYLMSGEKAAEITNSLQKSLEERRLALIYVPGYGNAYFLAPSYLNQENDLQYESPLVYLGFGNSFNADWREKFLYVLHAGACIGFDWYVTAERNISWARELYSLMGDTSLVSHITLKNWHDSIDTSYKYDNNHATSIKYYGPDNFYLWKKVRILELIPQSGQAGDTIEIHGAGFENNPEAGIVFIGNREGRTVSWSDTLITAIVPSGTTGNYIRVQVGKLFSNTADFFVEYAFKILSIEPDSAHPGEIIRIKGLNFGNSQGDKKLYIGIFETTPSTWSDTLITAYIPEDANSGEVYIKEGTYTSNICKIIIIREMLITRIEPDSGTYQDTMYIYGKGFGETSGGVCCEDCCNSHPILWTDTLIISRTCSLGLPENTYIYVKSGSLKSNKYPFRQLSMSTITSITPERIMFGDTVRINGYGFGNDSPDLRIFFGGKVVDVTSGSIISRSDSLIVLFAPENCSSGYALIYEKQHGYYWSNKYGFKVLGIKYLSPSISMAGKNVNIVGSGFGEVQGSSYISYGNPISWSDTLITITLPDNPSTHDISVAVDGVQSNSRTLKIPQISSITPLWTAPREIVEIRGSDFGDTTYRVRFYNRIGATIESWTDSLIRVVVPDNANSGSVELRFTWGINYYTPPITIFKVDRLWPTYGLPGDTIEIQGTGFSPEGMSGYVTLDDINAEVTYWSGTMIKFIVPQASDTSQVYVHVNNLQSIGNTFYNLYLPDIFYSLHQTQYCKIEFTGYMKLGYSWNNRTIIINTSEPDLVNWNLGYMQFGTMATLSPYIYEFFSYKGACSLLDISTGNIDSLRTEKRIVNYYDNVGVPDDWDKNYYSFTLDNVPISYSSTSEGGIDIVYELTGPDVQNHIYNINMYSVYETEMGYFSTNWQYIDTDWENTEYPPTIRVTFSNYPIP